MNPCVDYCYLRYGKQYSHDCDSKCEYAKVVLENKTLKKAIVHAQWLCNKENEYTSIASCSNCKKIGNIKYKFCPNCGAKMDIKN